MTASSTAPTRIRLRVLGLITLATGINYLDRAVMGVAAPSIIKDLGLTAATMGIIFSAFSWTYALAQIPGGILLDRLGTRITYTLSLVCWSLFTLMHGFATNVAAFLGFRLGLGAAEAPCFPANSRVLTSWFPQTERARANGVYSVGMYAGLAFFSPLLFWVVNSFGWRVLFIAFGAIGMLYGLVFYLVYRDPSQSRTVNQAELDHIAAGGAIAHDAQVGFSWASVGKLLSKRQILGASFGQFAGNVTLVFFLTWFPTYLAEERGMDWAKSGIFTLLPYVAATLGVLAGGLVSDLLIKRTGSPTLGRKLPIVTGLFLASTMMIAGYVESNEVVIAIMSLAFFGQGMVNLGWTLISDIAPKQLVGLTGGIFNFFTNLAGIVTPLVVGFVVSATGSFRGGLMFIGCVALAGALSYIFMVGEVRRIELD